MNNLAASRRLHVSARIIVRDRNRTAATTRRGSREQAETLWDLGLVESWGKR
jgi:hypothetical protein